jgi:hypothetical protein
MNRREVMVLGAAAVVTAGLPTLPAIASTPAKAAPVWLVGTPGEYDWQVVRADTELEAKIGWLSDWIGSDECENGTPISEACDCEVCSQIGGIDAERKPQLDGKQEITPGDWLRVGSGHICSRCSYETYADSGGHAVGPEAVCEDCMTTDDWEIVDPERAAELRAEAMDESE